MTSSTDTPIDEFMTDLDGGIFGQKVSAILSKIAGQVVDLDKKGKLDLSFEFERVGKSYQVQVTHKIKSSIPLARGETVETDKTTTLLHVNRGGMLSLFPENQGQMFDRSGQPNSSKENHHG
jgi:hypothetical protein